jgi:hypothetical protein
VNGPAPQAVGFELLCPTIFTAQNDHIKAPGEGFLRQWQPVRAKKARLVDHKHDFQTWSGALEH